jgi:hydroxyacylglutathione hydrolase
VLRADFSRGVTGSMFFRQLIDADLGCASYVIADAGEAIVVDPAIAIDQYLELAARHRFGIAHVVETHTHADHVSGNRRCGSPR